MDGCEVWDENGGFQEGECVCYDEWGAGELLFWELDWRGNVCQVGCGGAGDLLTRAARCIYRAGLEDYDEMN